MVKSVVGGSKTWSQVLDRPTVQDVIGSILSGD